MTRSLRHHITTFNVTPPCVGLLRFLLHDLVPPQHANALTANVSAGPIKQRPPEASGEQAGFVRCAGDEANPAQEDIRSLASSRIRAVSSLGALQERAVSTLR